MIITQAIHTDKAMFGGDEAQYDKNAQQTRKEVQIGQFYDEGEYEEMYGNN